ncbi:lipase family alpha/beta hydrolase [Nocardioides mangrovi]|uniref:GPI inositol-deacylase n=1 Tax=Nocardioides mangrovi TaxID=2874580 RepID=A0ABS7UIN4_9ACTN|nr:GPI inositol-deacylase [Nocardioides mangrovi]MBZ5740898.1 GPI inositol-deacylase [Nocardioides mangrovi]
MTSGPTYADAFSLLAEVADELVLRSVRDTHDAWTDRLGGYPGSAVTRAAYAGAGLGLRAASAGLAAVGETGLGPRLEDGPRGRFVSSAVNGLIGDRLAQTRPRMAIEMAVRRHGRDVGTGDLAATFPDATGRVAIFLHGLCETESYWDRGPGPTYGEALAGRGWTPVFLRANTGLGLRPNGVALSALVQDLVDAWPVPVTRIALVGHSMGGLILRAAGAVGTDADAPWTDLVSDVVTLGTPHLGAPIARGLGHGSRGLARLPETAAFGRILDWRSVGVHDLVEGLAADVPPLPHARYRLVAATVTTRARHPVGHVVGDLLVRVRSAYGEGLFPDGTVLHLGRTDHFGLLNHPEVHRALEEWLA